MLAVNQAKTHVLATAALLRWSREVWEAASFVRSRGYSPPQCRQMWEATGNSMGEAPTWRNIRGPLGAARLEAQRLGWSFASPFIVITDTGLQLKLTEVSPASLAQELAAAWERRLEAQLASKWLAPGPVRYSMFPVLQEQPLRLASASIRRYLRASGRTAAERAAVLALVCNAIWTRQRLWDKGLLLDVMCPLCKLAPDTIHHRLYHCRAVRALRSEVASRSFIAKAKRAGPTDLLFNRGWMVHPSPFWPRPAAEPSQTFEVMGSQGLEQKPTTDADEGFRGLIYQDGSCKPRVLPELSRASWAVVQVDEAGAVQAQLHGLVPSYLTQSAASAEWCSYIAVADMAVAEVHAHQDCKAVVDELSKPLSQQLATATCMPAQSVQR